MIDFLPPFNRLSVRNRHIPGLLYYAFLFLLTQGLSLFCTATCWGQATFTVTGTVRDTKGITLPSVTVRMKNGSASTRTDLNGKYSISLPDGNGRLLFTFIGMATADTLINGNRLLNIVMHEQLRSLTDVIVVGYGTQKKSDVTGSVVSLTEKDFKDYAAPNVSELLQGKAAGVYVATNSGQPGDVATVRIRGFGTVNDNNPLYVVDGQLFDNINNVNPSDIQNIEVLKDASATAIYGSRGSNGVILITTKKAVKGENTATFDAYIGSKSSYRSPHMQSSQQYYNFMQAAYKNNGASLDPRFTEQYNRGYNTNWWDQVSQTGLSQNYNFSIRNGTEKSRSYYSLGYLDDKGAIITTRFSRVSLKLNNEYDLSSHITVGVNLGLAKNQTQDASSLPYFNWILQADPFTPVINPNVSKSDPTYAYDKYAPTEWSFNPNPVSLLRLNNRSSDDLNLYGNIFGRWNIVKGLNYYAQYSFEDDNNQFKSFLPVYHSQFDTLNLSNMQGKFNDQSQLTNNSSSVQNYVAEQRLNFARIIGKHSFDAMVAMTYESNVSQGINAYKTTAPGNGEAFQVLDAATLGAQVSGGKLETSILSYLGRINYAYDNRFLATVNFRADGSSVFAPGNKWGYFPSFSLGWKINNERFFKNLGFDNLFSTFKVRAGWGETGNQRINSNAPVTLIGTGLENQINFGSGFTQGYLPTSIGNPKIKWETSEQANVGLDATLLNDRLNLTLDYFKKDTKNMLLQVPIPAIAGYPNYPFENAGSVNNTGVEASASYRNTTGKFTYMIGGNASFYKNRVTSLGNGGLPLYGNVSKTEVGGSMSRFYGYVFQGIFQNQQQIDSYTGPAGQKILPNAVPGDFKFADLNHDGVIDDKDRTYIGNPHPSLIFGFNLGLTFQGFDLSAFFQGTLGNQLFNGTKSTLSTPGEQNALADAYTKAWVKEGDNASFPRISLTDNNNNFRTSSWYVENGSFLRLQNAQLGYSIPPSVLQKTKILRTCRLYISGQNLFTITRYTGLDPEIGSNNALNIGYDPIRYPSSRTLIVGINARF